MSLSVIHFSDIHIKGADDVILKRIDKLKSACVSSLPNNGDVVIAISGDIAFSGTEQQYSLAKGLIDSISCYIAEQKTSKVYVVCVPGNHEVISQILCKHRFRCKTEQNIFKAGAAEAVSALSTK